MLYNPLMIDLTYREEVYQDTVARPYRISHAIQR
jgi:hypothetical protein